MISYEYKTIFVHINKTAGTSVEKVFNVNSSIADRKHLTACQIKDRVGPLIWQSYFKFSIVRNPWDKMVSMYFHRRQNSDVESLPKKVDFQLWIKNLPYINRKKKKTTNQLFWITDSNENIIVDYIAKFENLNEDWEYVKLKCGINKKLPHINKSVHNSYREYYDDETKDIVAKRFKKDIEYFGYEF